jgi:hypothetical protein
VFVYVCCRSVVHDPTLTASFGFYTDNRQTWAVENFYSHSLLSYCPKRVSYSYDGYVIRNQLAVLDHNHHTERPTYTTQEVSTSVISQFSRKTKKWVAYARLSSKDYAYMPGMLFTSTQNTVLIILPKYKVMQTTNQNKVCITMYVYIYIYI